NAGERIGWLIVIGAKFFNERQDPYDKRAATDQDDAENEDPANAQGEPVVQAEDEAVSFGLKPFLAGERHHNAGASFVDQFRYGDKLKAARPQLINDDRKSGDGLAAVAAAVVEKND